MPKKSAAIQTARIQPAAVSRCQPVGGEAGA
jgi:hypothetical protein